jgi:hypothetical protein
MFRGLILDQYDTGNPREMAKEATINPSSLSDNQFALVLLEGGQKFRKYATATKDDTVLSTMYFLSTGGKLPEEAQKVAAINLHQSLLTYGVLPPPELQSLVKESAIPKGLVDWSTGRDEKVKESKGNCVSTEGKKAPEKVMRKVSSEFAMGKKYPIDSLDRIAKAVDYFKRYYKNFSPSERREFSTKVAHASEQYGLPLPRIILDYSSTEKCASSLEYAFISRQNLLTPESGDREDLLELAKLSHTMTEEHLVESLERFDTEKNLDRYWDIHIPNPVLSVYKFAEEDLTALLFEQGNDRMSKHQLNTFLQKTDSKNILLRKFDSDLVEGMYKDPYDVYSSLPDSHKQIIARLATDNSDGRDLAHPA